MTADFRATALASAGPRGGSASTPPRSGAVTSVRALQKVNPLHLRKGAKESLSTVTSKTHPSQATWRTKTRICAKKNRRFKAKRRRNTRFPTLFAASCTKFTSSGAQETASRLSFTVSWDICVCFRGAHVLKIAALLAWRLKLPPPNLFTSFHHIFLTL